MKAGLLKTGPRRHKSKAVIVADQAVFPGIDISLYIHTLQQ